MKVYRFENSAGRGPWQGGGVSCYDGAQRTRDKRHRCGDMPGPVSEGRSTSLHKHYRKNGVEGMLFGFASLRQLKLSFPSSVGRAAMAEAAQRLMVYEVHPGGVLKGNRQVIFNKGAGKPVAELDLKTLKHVRDVA